MALAKARLGDLDGAMTAAMDYRQLGGTASDQLFAQIERIRAQLQGGTPGATPPAPTAAPQTDADAQREFELGRVAYGAERYDEARRHFETAFQSPGLEPSRRAQLIYNLAIARARLGDFDGALTDAMDYSQYGGTGSQRLFALIERIRADRSGTPAGTPGSPTAPPQTDAEARSEFEQGRRAYDAHDYRAALRHFEAAIASPGIEQARRITLLWSIAHAHARLGNADGAWTAAVDYRDQGGESAPQLEAEVGQILALPPRLRRRGERTPQE